MKLMPIFKNIINELDYDASALKNIQRKYNLDAIPYEFVNIEHAKSYKNKVKFPSKIMIGDNGKYWVVSLNDSEKLHKNGYDYLN